MGIINPSRGVLEPASEHLLSEPAIVAGLARATLGDAESGRLGRPYRRITTESAITSSTSSPASSVSTNGSRRMFSICRTPRAITANSTTKSAKRSSPFIRSRAMNWSPADYIMMTIRSHDQFNTHIYGLDDRYRGISQRPARYLHESRGHEGSGLEPGSIRRPNESFRRRANNALRDIFRSLPIRLPRGCTATYFPEANVLVPINSVADARTRRPASS